MNLTLVRVHEPSATEPTFGLLEDGLGAHLLVTLERPWRNNEVGVSCIPLGTYRCVRTDSPHFGDTFEVLVEGRSHILFHSGNIDADTHGCIILGTHFGTLDGQPAVLESKTAREQFMQSLVGVNEFSLEVRPAM